jgi:hypothetical protein
MSAARGVIDQAAGREPDSRVAVLRARHGRGAMRRVEGVPGGAQSDVAPEKQESPGCGTRGSPWSGGAPVGRLRKVSALRPSRFLSVSPPALPLHSTWRPAVVQGALTLGAFSRRVK